MPLNTMPHQNQTKADDNGPRVLQFECIKEEFVPKIDRDGRTEVRDEEEEDGGGQKPRARSRLPAPESKREA